MRTTYVSQMAALVQVEVSFQRLSRERRQLRQLFVKEKHPLSHLKSNITVL